MGRNRKASDIMAECIIEMLEERKQTIGHLKIRIKKQNDHINYLRCRMERAVTDCNEATDTLGEIADIITACTEHTVDGNIMLYLSNTLPENAAKLERLFKLLDIPMTADQIKGDIQNEES